MKPFSRLAAVLAIVSIVLAQAIAFAHACDLRGGSDGRRVMAAAIGGMDCCPGETTVSRNANACAVHCQGYATASATPDDVLAALDPPVLAYPLPQSSHADAAQAPTCVVAWPSAPPLVQQYCRFLL